MSNFNILDEVKNLEEALKCEVCKNLLNDPLLVAKCGHSICRQCFLGNFNMKCPVCGVPVNTKDSLEDKLLKELLLQLKKLKQIVENDVNFEKTEAVPVIKDFEPISIFAKPSDNDQSVPENATNVSEEKMLPKADEDHANFAKQNISCSIPKVRRKKVLPRTKLSRLSGGEENIVQGTPDSSSRSKFMANSFKRSQSSSRSEDKDKSAPSLNMSLQSSGGHLNKKNHKGETLLHRAVIKGDMSKIKELIAEGASVNTQDNNGWTPLHEASNHGYVEIAKLLLDNGALVNVPSLKDNITPLHDALINDQMQIAILLVSRGADMYTKTSMGYTAFDLCKNEEDKKILIESCSPFISSNIPVPKKMDNEDNKITLLHTSLDDKQKEKLQKLAQLLKANIVDSFVPEVTHIITSCDNNGNCTRTMKVLMGILTGKWIMNYQWIDVCLEYKQKVDEEVLEVQGTKNQPNTQGPKLARRNMEQKLPPLFDGFYFYLHGQFHKPTPEREDLCNLIHLGGGKILSREPREDTVASESYGLPYHAQGTLVEGINHIILFQDKPPRDHHFRTSHICTTQVMWLIECITEFKLKDFKQSNEK